MVGRKRSETTGKHAIFLHVPRDSSEYRPFLVTRNELLFLVDVPGVSTPKSHLKITSYHHYVFGK